MRSPHRERADAGESFVRLVFGEIVRAIDRPVVVRADRTIKLPRSGWWEKGLARLRPALDDALGSTALAVAWRWACVEADGLAWPSLELIATKATDRRVTFEDMPELARYDDGTRIVEGPGDSTWRFDGTRIGIIGAHETDFTTVDRVVAIAEAWLEPR